MFRLLGKKLELCRYKTSYYEELFRRDTNMYSISESHKNEIEQFLNGKGIQYTTTPITQTGKEWINGLEFNSYDEAGAAYYDTEENYYKKKQESDSINQIKLRADIDYIAIIMGNGFIAWFDKVKLYYDGGLWDKERVWRVVNKAITEEEYTTITGDPYSADSYEASA